MTSYLGCRVIFKDMLELFFVNLSSYFVEKVVIKKKLNIQNKMEVGQADQIDQRVLIYSYFLIMTEIPLTVKD